MPWNYDDQTKFGPKNWPKLYPTEGLRQSPINIIVNQDDKFNSTCCHGRILTNSQSNNRMTITTTNINSTRKFNDQDVDLNRLRLNSTTRKHLDSTGQELRTTSPDSGRPSNDSYSDTNNSDRSATNSPQQTQLQPIKHKQHSNQYELDSNNNNNDNNYSKIKTKNNDSLSHQETRFCISKRKLFLGYPRYLDMVALENNGHAWQANIPSQISQHTLLSGPPFGDRKFRLAQFHCHWGRDCNSGSEHTINGRSYSAELHFVHWNCSEFNSFEEAAKHGHGLAVLGVLVQALEGDQNKNRHLERISSQLRKIRKANTSANVSLGLDLKRLFPANRWQYATYEGSLTTPPLSEIVHWLVFTNPIQCSSSQLDEMRQLECGQTANLMLENCRPIQETNGRLVSIWSHH